MNTNSLQISLEKIAENILIKNGCENLPAENREAFESQIKTLLLQRWINTMFSTLTEEEAAEFIAKAESTTDELEVLEYLSEIFGRYPDAENTLLSEATYLESELTNS
ncbi:MAG: hypothetical protein PHO48_00060 [Candidatus Gracilibacteria bacterium]|nr:hypothetical protein [Candidatus Gracilibacteria bacterium]MDD5178663.1 hypothetical protein [Candidatus Gracilibacteria bacterium]